LQLRNHVEPLPFPISSLFLLGECNRSVNFSPQNSISETASRLQIRAEAPEAARRRKIAAICAGSAIRYNREEQGRENRKPDFRGMPIVSARKG
jgi:hypothetical protein